MEKLKLSEIRKTLEDLRAQEPAPEESVGEFSQRIWEQLPRIPYKDLPASLQKQVRERFTPDTMRHFLRECYAPLPLLTKKMAMQQVAEWGAQTGTSPEEYLSFDGMTADIPADDVDKLLIRTRNMATYTIEIEGYSEVEDEDGTKQTVMNIVPMLYGNYAIEAFESVLEKYVDAAKQHGEGQKEGGRKKANANPNSGSIVSAGFYQFVISDSQYKHALTPQRNKNAYIALMNPDFFKGFEFVDGVLTYDAEIEAIIKNDRRGEYTDIKDLDLPLLQQIYTAACRAHMRFDAPTITVSTPQFFREMGIEPSKGNAPDIMRKLHSFENCVGIMPSTQTVSALFSIIDIDAKNQTMTFAIPYLIRLIAILEEKNHVERTTRAGELIDYIQPYNNCLCHSKIASERNKVAVEIVQMITSGLLRRGGTTPDEKTYRKKNTITNAPRQFTYTPSFKFIINNCPLLRGRIHSYQRDTDKNKALRRAFEKAYELLETRTDAHQYFVNLKYSKIIPTITTLDDKLIFTYDGINGDYKPKN